MRFFWRLYFKKVVNNILILKYRCIAYGIPRKIIPFATCVAIASLLYYGFCFVRPKDQVLSTLMKNAFNPEFTGATVCGHFSCFGKTLCDKKGLKINNLNSTSIRTYKGTISISGETINSYHKIEDVVINFPLTESCETDFCTLCLKPEMFSLESYQNWICRNFGFNKGCNVIEVLHDWPQMKQLLGQSGKIQPSVLKGMSPPFTCASSRLVDRLVRRTLGALQGKGSELVSDYTYEEKAELIFTCKMSPGTVMQKMFPFYEGWIIKQSLGTCGLMTMHKHSLAPTLYDIYHAPWKTRLDVAVQLLDLARYFTENDSKFILLLHRLTPLDLGISKNGKLIIQNSENIIVIDSVDPHHKFEPKYRETAFHKDRFYIAEQRICDYNRTDINYYTVCRYFLTGSWKGIHGNTLEGGLLHDPEELSDFKSQMYILLDLCNRGSLAVPKDEVKVKIPVRAAAAGHLRSLLDSVQECTPEYRYRYPECELYENSERRLFSSNFELQWLR